MYIVMLLNYEWNVHYCYIQVIMSGNMYTIIMPWRHTWKDCLSKMIMSCEPHESWYDLSYACNKMINIIVSLQLKPNVFNASLTCNVIVHLY